MENQTLKTLTKNIKRLNGLKDEAYRDKLICDLSKNLKIQPKSDELKKVEEKLDFYNQINLNPEEAKEKVAAFNKKVVKGTVIKTIICLILIFALGSLMGLIIPGGGIATLSSLGVIGNLFLILPACVLTFGAYLLTKQALLDENPKEFNSVHKLRDILKLSKEELTKVLSELEEKKVALESEINAILEDSKLKDERYDELRKLVYEVNLRLSSLFSIEEKETLSSEVENILTRFL